jgi:hypothetical protein
MSAAISTPGDLRAQLLREYADSDVFPARQAALEQLGKTGPSGVATIRQVLDDRRFGDEKPDLIQAPGERTFVLSLCRTIPVPGLVERGHQVERSPANAIFGNLPNTYRTPKA